jgi:hypothetical protein
MPVCLWHCTLPENVAGILENGFHGSSDFVHLAAAGDTYWRDSVRTSIVEVFLNVDDEELADLGHREVSEDRQRFDPVTRTHVNIDDPSDYYRQVTYRIPTAFVNANTISRREVTPEE